MIRNKQHIDEIKQNLLSQLKAEHVFWSYAPETVNAENLSDDRLIALTMRHLDLS